ncbi:MAG: TIR domain-containing protein [Pseudomonadota bacterium]
METIFVTFNDETDSARANHVRKQLLSTERYLVAGYSPYTTWAKTKSGDSLENLRASFDRELKSASTSIVMVGEDSATNPWIRYAIERCYVLSKPLFALDISAIPDELGKACTADLNPLERFAVLEHGKKVYLSDRYESHVWRADFLECLGVYLQRARASAAKIADIKADQQSARSTNYRDYESMRLDRATVEKR